MSKANYRFLTLLNPAFGGAAKPHLTGGKSFLDSLTLVYDSIMLHRRSEITEASFRVNPLSMR